MYSFELQFKESILKLLLDKLYSHSVSGGFSSRIVLVVRGPSGSRHSLNEHVNDETAEIICRTAAQLGKLKKTSFQQQNEAIGSFV